MDITIGDIVGGKYRIERKIGAGGFATVYLAEHTIVESHHVALKVLHKSQDEEMRARFSQEALALGTLRSPHTVRLLDFGITDANVPFMVMEYADGMSLTRALRTSPITEVEAARYTYGICLSLVEAHSHGIMHRDLKPDNVILVQEDDWEHRQAVVLDFGIAKIMDSAKSLKPVHVTQTGFVICTPEYAAPELIASNPKVQSDIYSLGIVLYEMLTGDVPYDGPTPTVIAAMHLDNTPIPVPPSIVGTPLGDIFSAAVAKDFNQRFQSAVALANALRSAYPAVAPPRLTPAFGVIDPPKAALADGPTLELTADHIKLAAPRPAENWGSRATRPMHIAQEAADLGEAGGALSTTAQADTSEQLLTDPMRISASAVDLAIGQQVDADADAIGLANTDAYSAIERKPDGREARDSEEFEIAETEGAGGFAQPAVPYAPTVAQAVAGPATTSAVPLSPDFSAADTEDLDRGGLGTAERDPGPRSTMNAQPAQPMFGAPTLGKIRARKRGMQSGASAALSMADQRSWSHSGNDNAAFAARGETHESPEGDLLARLHADPSRQSDWRKLYKLRDTEGRIDAAFCALACLRALDGTTRSETLRHAQLKDSMPQRPPKPIDQQARSSVEPIALHRDLARLFEILGATAVSDIALVETQRLRYGQLSRINSAADWPLLPLFSWATAALQQETLEYVVAEEIETLRNGNASPITLLVPRRHLGARPSRSWMFIAARAVAMMHPRYYLTSALGTVEKLRAWLLATTTAMASEAASGDARVRVVQALPSDVRDELRDTHRLIVQDGLSLDLDRWVRAVDIAVDRTGLLACGDVAAATRRIQDGCGSIGFYGRKERVADLLRFSSSELFLDARARCGMVVSITSSV